MDKSAAQSQENNPSVGTSNNQSDPQTSAEPQSDDPVFVNQGKLLLYAPVSLNRWFFWWISGIES